MSTNEHGHPARCPYGRSCCAPSAPGSPGGHGEHAKPRWLASGAGVCSTRPHCTGAICTRCFWLFRVQERCRAGGLPCVPPKRWWICRALRILECSSSAASPVAAQLFVRVVFLPVFRAASGILQLISRILPGAEQTWAASPARVCVQHLSKAEQPRAVLGCAAVQGRSGPGRALPGRA